MPIGPETPLSTPQFHQGHHSLDPHHHQHPFLIDVPSRQQKKLVVLGLGGPLAVWTLELPEKTLLNLASQPPWQPLGNLNMFLPVDPPPTRLPLLLIAWEVHHRSDPSSVLLHDLGENGQRMKLLILANALRGPSPI